MPAFPRDLAKAVVNRWDHIVVGQYEAPPCPELRELTYILECCYLAASSPEEARYPSYNVIVSPAKTNFSSNSIIGSYLFSEPRLLSVAEIRRLAPAVDVKKSAIWINYKGTKTAIQGIVDLGTSWHRSRAGFSYHYKTPKNLIVQVDRPGRLKIYQGQYHVASLSDGELIVPAGIDVNLFLHKSIERGLSSLVDEIEFPEFEHPKEYESFWFMALWNVFAAVANTISSSGHGGLIVIAPDHFKSTPELLRIKYASEAVTLRTAFLKFINSRNRSADFHEKADLTGQHPPPEFFQHASAVNSALDHLAETIRFVSQLAGCDGAIVLTSELKLLGFGAEIRAEIASGLTISEVSDEMRRIYRSCDIEQFGMRHRSAIKLASRMPDGCILAISQDGPVTAVWRERDQIFVKKGVALTNMNMPWM